MNEDIKYTIQKIFGSYSISVTDDYISKTYYDVQDDIIRIIKQLEKQNTELKEQVEELKHIMYVIRDDNGLNHLWCKDMILDWLGSDSK